MQIRKISSMETEKKELLIFLLVTFGMPFLMSFPIGILFHTGKDVSSYTGAIQALYPAAGLMLSKIICDKNNSLMPKRLFIGFLSITGIMTLWCFSSFFLPDQTVLNGTSYLSMGGSITVVIFLFLEKGENLSAYGLSAKNWKPCVLPLLWFLALCFVRILLIYIDIGKPAELLDIFSPFNLLSTFLMMSISFFMTIAFFLGEEYGWRVYFQPLLQKKFGLIKGVFVFAVLWEIWHLPPIIFDYAHTEEGMATTFVQLILIRLITTMMFAIFLAYAYMKTHNVWLPALVHFLNNSYLLFLPTDEIRNQQLTWGMLGMYALFQMVLFLPFLFSKVFRKQRIAT